MLKIQRLNHCGLIFLNYKRIKQFITIFYFFSEPHPNIIKLKDSYIMHSKDRQSGSKCLVIVMEDFDATLTEITAFRKKNNWKFTE